MTQRQDQNLIAGLDQSQENGVGLVHLPLGLLEQLFVAFLYVVLLLLLSDVILVLRWVYLQIDLIESCDARVEGIRVLVAEVFIVFADLPIDHRFDILVQIALQTEVVQLVSLAEIGPSTVAAGRT